MLLISSYGGLLYDYSDYMHIMNSIVLWDTWVFLLFFFNLNGPGQDLIWWIVYEYFLLTQCKNNNK